VPGEWEGTFAIQHYEPEANALFRNNGDGTFTDVSAEQGSTRTRERV
jgi:hypothetical protein